MAITGTHNIGDTGHTADHNAIDDALLALPSTYAQVFGVAAPTGVGATDTANVQAKIAACIAAGGGTVQLQAGTYVVANISLGSNVTLAGAGMGATILLHDPNPSISPANTSGSGYTYDLPTLRINVTSSTQVNNVVMRDFTVDGNKTVLHTLDSTYRQYGIYVGGATGQPYPYDIQATRVEVRNCKSYAWDIIRVNRAVFSQCTAHDNGIDGTTNNSSSGFEILADDIKLLGCTAYNNQVGYRCGETGIIHYRVELISCTAQGNANEGVSIHDGTQDSSVIGGAYRGNLLHGIALYNSSLITVTGASVTGNTGAGIRVGNCNYCTVTGNVVDQNSLATSTYEEIRLVSTSTGNTVANNIVNTNAVPNPAIVESSGCVGNIVTGNVVKGSGASTASGTGSKWSLNLPATQDNTYAPIGRATVSLYDDFSGYVNGSPSGIAPLIGPAWATTGAQAPTVTSGAVNSAGTGYLYGALAVQPRSISCEVSFTGDPTIASMTMAFSKDVPLSLANMVHCNFGPNGFGVALRQDTEANFATNNGILFGNWRRPMATDGTVYRVTIAIKGTTATVYGPFGEEFSVNDAAVAYLSGRTVMFEPNTNASPAAAALLHTVAAIAEATTGQVGTFRVPGDAGGQGVDSYQRIAGSRGFASEVSIGTDVTTGFPSITFGPSGGSVILATLGGATSIGATSFISDRFIPSGSSVRIDLGNNEETIVTSGDATGTGPYTVPCPALGTAHAIGVRMGATPSSNWGSKIVCADDWGTLNFAKAVTFGSGSTGVQIQAAGLGTGIYFGTAYDLALVRDSAGVLAVGGTTGLGSLKTGQAVTGSRPSAAAVGAGAQFYDTSLAIPIWSNGSVWKNAAGATV